jgi:hypothetical protein
MTSELHYSEADYVAAQAAWLTQHPFTLVRGFWYPVAIIVVMVIAVANHPGQLAERCNRGTDCDRLNRVQRSHDSLAMASSIQQDSVDAIPGFSIR